MCASNPHFAVVVVTVNTTAQMKELHQRLGRHPRQTSGRYSALNAHITVAYIQKHKYSAVINKLKGKGVSVAYSIADRVEIGWRNGTFTTISIGASP
jgi:2'-5' RNA ligase